MKDKSVFKQTQNSHELNWEVGRTGRVFFFPSTGFPPRKIFLPRWSFSSERKEVARNFAIRAVYRHIVSSFSMLRTIFTFLRKRISIRMKGPRHENVLVRVVEKKILRRFLFSAVNAVRKRFQSKPNIPDTQSIATIASLQL